MARDVGASLPADILARLQSAGRESRANDVILAFSVDEHGWPHATMLSYLEVVALDAVRLRAAVFASSSLARHVRGTGRLTFVLVSAGLACYVKAEARVMGVDLPGLPRLAAIEARVRDVRLDEADPGRDGAGALVSGIIYRRADPAGDAERARPILEALSALPPMDWRD